jgi:signal transduction histidine kinase
MAASDFSVDAFTTARAYMAEARRYFELSNFPEAEKFCRQALELFEQQLPFADNLPELSPPTYQSQEYIPFFTDLIDCHNRLGLVLKMRGSYPEARQHIEKALELCNHYPMELVKASILNNLGNVYMRMGDYVQSLSLLEQALKIHSAHDKDVEAGDDLNNIGMIYWYLQNYEECLHFYQRAIALYEKAAHQVRLEQMHINIGAVYLEKNQPERALEYFDNALAYNAISGNERHKAIILLNSANALFNTKDFEKAIEAYNKSLEIHNSTGMRNGTATILGNLGSIYGNKDFAGYSPEMAEEYMRRAISLLEEIGDKRTLYKVTDTLAELLSEQERWEEAYQMMLSFHELEKEVQSEEAQKAIERTTIEFLEREKNMLEEKNAQLRDLHQEKNEFMGIASHDLKNPLNSIQLIAQYLLDYEMSEEERQSYYDDILNLSQKMFSIITKLLDVNAIEQGRIETNPTAVNIQGLLRRIMQVYIPQAEAKDITICLQDNPQHEPEALCDEGYTEQVLDNLISNAIKFSPLGKQIFLRCAVVDTMVRIEVQDQGPGLSEDDHKRLFTKFARLSATSTAGEHSTGLGLSIVRKIVELMHGTVRCESTLGNGATFIVELPATHTSALLAQNA